MLLKQVFKTWEGAAKRAGFERLIAKSKHNSGRSNVNWRYFVVRCINGVPDGNAWNSAVKYDYRIERTVNEHPTDPRSLS